MSAGQATKDSSTSLPSSNPGLSSGSGTSTGSVAFIRQDHSHALQPISAEERGPRPSAADAECAESVLLDSHGRPVWLPSSSQDESPFPGIQIDRQRRSNPYKGVEIELQPMGASAQALLLQGQLVARTDSFTDEWAPLCLTPTARQAIELQQCFVSQESFRDEDDPQSKEMQSLQQQSRNSSGEEGDRDRDDRRGHFTASRSDPSPEPVISQADFHVMSAHANFVSVHVPKPSGSQSEQSSDDYPPQSSPQNFIWDLAEQPTVSLLCTSRGLLKKMKQKVFVGDIVTVSNIDWIIAQGIVEDVIPRETELANPPVANIDQMLLVFSLDKPPWDGQMATRFLVSAEASNLDVTVLLNKADLVSEETRSRVKAEVEGWGYNAICLSASSGLGLTDLEKSLESRVSVTAGPSGVGKSSLINAINAQLKTATFSDNGSIDISRNGSQNGAESPEAKLSDLAVGTVSQIGRGKHTTRNITLLPVAGGLLADTPGFNQPALEGVQPENLMSFFPEIEDIISECKYGNCKHIDDDGCAVRENWSRHAWYVELYLELEAAAAVQRARASSKKNREGNVKFKTKGGQQSMEVLLDPKKHRNVSRRQEKMNVMDLLAEEEEIDRD